MFLLPWHTKEDCQIWRTKDRERNKSPNRFANFRKSVHRNLCLWFLKSSNSIYITETSLLKYGGIASYYGGITKIKRSWRKYYSWKINAVLGIYLKKKKKSRGEVGGGNQAKCSTR